MFRIQLIIHVLHVKVQTVINVKATSTYAQIVLHISTINLLMVNVYVLQDICIQMIHVSLALMEVQDVSIVLMMMVEMVFYHIIVHILHALNVIILLIIFFLENYVSFVL